MRKIRIAFIVVSSLIALMLIAPAMAIAQTNEPLTVRGFLEKFWEDGKVEVLIVLIALDFLLGVIAALKLGTFRLSYVADFVRKDVVFKIGGYLLIYGAALYAGQTDIVIPGLDLGVIAGAAYVTIVAAMVGSILNSAREIGFTDTPESVDRNVIDMITADEHV